MDPDKKISFGFSRVARKPNIFQKPPESSKSIQLIDCVEEKSIKLKNCKVEIKGPLVIPMPLESTKNIVDRVKEARNKQVSNEQKPDSELTSDEIAARELLKDVQNGLAQTNSAKVAVLPKVPDELILEGKEESTLDDYEKVPISDYGLAMLRGMGWAEGLGIGKNQKISATTEPSLRPKGMGLGANKLANKPKEPPKDQDGNELILKVNAFGKILAGAHKGNYCQVQGFDDEAGRIIVKTALKSAILTLNEFLVAPVHKEEYEKFSKVLNAEKFEQYSKDSEQNEDDEKIIRNKHRSRSKSREKPVKSKQYNSDSESSDNDRKRHKHKKSKKKSKKKEKSYSPVERKHKHKSRKKNR